ncbi:MAG: hypothetical protein WC905_04500, partial [Patescibacteria group bacterium]
MFSIHAVPHQTHSILNIFVFYIKSIYSLYDFGAGIWNFLVYWGIKKNLEHGGIGIFGGGIGIFWGVYGIKKNFISKKNREPLRKPRPRDTPFLYKISNA